MPDLSFQGNFYWVPGTKREDVKVLQYADRLKVYQHRQCVAEYPLPANGVKNGRFAPEGQPAPRHQPRHRQQSSQLEEKRLRALGTDVAAYVDYVLATPGIQRHRFLRELFALSQQVTQAPCSCRFCNEPCSTELPICRPCNASPGCI